MYRAVPDDAVVEAASAHEEQYLREAILRYMDKSGHLARVMSFGHRYKSCVLEKEFQKKERSLPSFTYEMELDLLEIADECDELCLAILEAPMSAQKLFRQVVHCSLVTLCLLPTVGLDQVQVVLRANALPAEKCLKTDGTPKRPDPAVRRLLLLQGVVTALTPVTKYTRSAVSRCSKALCPGAVGRRVWGAAASATRCHSCNGALDEVPRGRDVGEQMLAQMVHPGALAQSDRTPSVNHPVIVRFADDLVRGEPLQPGCRYDVVVLSGDGGGPGGSHAEAWGFRPWLDAAAVRVHRGLRSAPLPEAIQALWLDTSAAGDSPWAFAVSLASQLGAGRFPPHAFLHLKLGVLLSLASQGLDHPPVPLVAVGRDPAGATLLSACSGLAHRDLAVHSVAGFARATAAPTLAGEVKQGLRAAGGGPGCAWLSAGPLVLARGGVCLLGSWDKWSRSSAATVITQALESGRTTLERRDVAGSVLAGVGPGVALQCAVWSYWSPGSWGKASDLLTLKTILNTLGVPILAETVSDVEVEDVCEHLLNKAKRLQVTPAVSESEMKEFISLVNAQPIALTDEATRLIRDYFVASRRVRPSCLPVNAVSTIAAMAEALARISLRVEATWADVVLVVWMYEEAFTALFGPCLVNPLPEICRQPIPADQIIYQMNSRLNSMKFWLENFINSILLSSLRAQND